MQIGAIIADFDMSFTTSFKYTAKVKYNVNFITSSNVLLIKENLKILKANIQAGKTNDVHVGYDFTLQDVEHIEDLLNIMVNCYLEYFKSIPPKRKMYTLIQQLKEVTNPTNQQIIKETIQELLTPQPKEKLSRKEQIKADAKLKSKERALNLIQKRSSKNKGK